MGRPEHCCGRCLQYRPKKLYGGPRTYGSCLAQGRPTHANYAACEGDYRDKEAEPVMEPDGKRVSDDMQDLLKVQLNQVVHEDPDARRGLEGILNQFFTECRLLGLVPSGLWPSSRQGQRSQSVIVHRVQGDSAMVRIVLPEPLQMWMDEECLKAHQEELNARQDILPGVK